MTNVIYDVYFSLKLSFAFLLLSDVSVAFSVHPRKTYEQVMKMYEKFPITKWHSEMLDTPIM